MADKDFYPCEVWIPRDSEARHHLSGVMYEHIWNGGSLYMIEERIDDRNKVVPSAKALISTSENGLDDPDPESFCEEVPLGILVQEVRVKEDKVSSCPEWMGEHARNGGSLYMRRSYISKSDTGEFAMIRTEKDGGKSECLPVSYFEPVPVTDFSEAVDAILIEENGMEQ